MKVQTKNAACIAGRTAKENKQLKKVYPKTIPMSSPAIQIGELLLLLLAGNGQAEGWQRFDQLLRQFYDGRI